MRRCGLPRQLVLEARRNGHRDGVGGARIGVQIAFQVPAGIEWNPHISDARFIENAMPQHAFDRGLGPILRIHHQGYGASLAGQGGGMTKRKSRCGQRAAFGVVRRATSSCVTAAE